MQGGDGGTLDFRALSRFTIRLAPSQATIRFHRRIRLFQNTNKMASRIFNTGKVFVPQAKVRCLLPPRLASPFAYAPNPCAAQRERLADKLVGRLWPSVFGGVRDGTSTGGTPEVNRIAASRVGLALDVASQDRPRLWPLPRPRRSFKTLAGSFQSQVEGCRL